MSTVVNSDVRKEESITVPQPQTGAFPRVEAMANGLREYLQQRNLTPAECVEIATRLVGSFALDVALDDRFKAASVVRRTVLRLSREIEAGKFRVVRGV